jgi:phosphatidyl-myo-inositol alpha-mannosyltransferase
MVSPYDYVRSGGVSEHVRNLAAALRALGHGVTVMAPSGMVDDDHDIPHFVRIGRTVALRGNRSVAHVGLSFHLAHRVRTFVDREGFDVVHYHEPLLPALPITMLRFHEGTNVGTFHAYARRNLGYYHARPLLRGAFQRLDACIAVSVPARDFISRYFPADYRVIPNGVDTTRFRPGVEPLDSLRTRGVTTLLYVGRLEARKGVDVLLDAAAELRRQGRPVQVVIVGDGHLRYVLEHRAEQVGLDGVRFEGHVAADTLPRYFATADVVCAPATGGESFGIVLLEAMASGVPVVASDIPGYAQVVEADRTGLLVPPRDADALAGALGRLIDDPQRRQAMGERARAAALAYDWSAVARSVLAVYVDAQDHARRRHAGSPASAVPSAPAPVP